MTSSIEERIKAVSLICHDFCHGIEFEYKGTKNGLCTGTATSSFAHIHFETAVFYSGWIITLEKTAPSKVTWVVSAYKDDVRYCLTTVNDDDRNDKFMDFIKNKVCY